MASHDFVIFRRLCWVLFSFFHSRNRKTVTFISKYNIYNMNPFIHRFKYTGTHLSITVPVFSLIQQISSHFFHNHPLLSHCLFLFLVFCIKDNIMTIIAQSNRFISNLSWVVSMVNSKYNFGLFIVAFSIKLSLDNSNTTI